MMKRIDLFPSSLYKIKIDPCTWDKQKFVSESIQSYNIDPHRHAKNMPESEFHTTYADWNNEKFNRIDCSVLTDVYSKVISDLINNIKFSRQVEYSWDLINVSIGKDNWYDYHYHGGLPINGFFNQYVMVHYIKFDKETHRSTCFKNPLNLFESACMIPYDKIMNHYHVENSSYFYNYEVDTDEDDVIIFPSYLKHGVFKKFNNTDKFRIITSTHINLKYTIQELNGD